MIEAAMIWNEPNNKSHWDPELDPGLEPLRRDGDRRRAGDPGRERRASARARRHVADRSGLRPNMADKRRARPCRRVAVHGFPLDWNLWQIHEWPAKIDEIRAVTDLPIWVSEVGISTFGAEEVQVWGLERTAELLVGKAPRIHWYSLYDLPRAWEATTRHREAEGSSYYRHFYMGILREDGSPKPAAEAFAKLTPELGICQWFHFEDHRLDDAVAWMKRLGVTYLRTGLSWADSFRPNALDWFDRQMDALAEFDVTVTFCFTPEHRGIAPHHTSPPLVKEEFAEFCAAMIRRYAPGAGASKLELLQAAV